MSTRVDFATDTVGGTGTGRLSPQPVAREPLTLGDCTFDLDGRVLRRRGALVRLSCTETAVLLVLAERAGQFVPAAAILRTAWGPDYGSELGYVWGYVRRLRLKLGDQTGSILVNEPGVGYMLDVTESRPAPDFAVLEDR